MSLASESEIAALTISAPSAKLQNSAYESIRHTREHQEPSSEPHPFVSQGRSSRYLDTRRSMAEYFGQAGFTSPHAEVDQDDAFGNEDEFGRREAAAEIHRGKMAQGRKSSTYRQGENIAKGSSLSIPPSPGPPTAQLPPLPTSHSAGPYQQHTSRPRSTTASSSTSLTFPTRRKSRIPSRDILQSALDLAQRAVTADGENEIPSALAMYRDAMGKLRSVMGRVGIELEPLDRGLGVPEPGEEEMQEIREAAGRRRRGSGGRSGHEGQTLKGIVSRSGRGVLSWAEPGVVCVARRLCRSYRPPLSDGPRNTVDLTSVLNRGGIGNKSIHKWFHHRPL